MQTKASVNYFFNKIKSWCRDYSVSLSFDDDWERSQRSLQVYNPVITINSGASAVKRFLSVTVASTLLK